MIHENRYFCSNRTFMELKFWNDAGGKMGIWF